jgi:large subunit ribosomal protein L1
MQEKRGSVKESVSVEDAITRLRNMADVKVSRSYKNARNRKKFDQTVEVVMHLGIDPKQADQMIRGSVSLPHGIGKSKRVIAFCEDEMVDQAKAAGAVEAGSDELVKRVQDGWMDFDVAVAHPKMMGKVGKLGRILGPSGKMPSPKSGTVTPKIEDAIKEYAAGKIEYRNDAGGNIHAVVGRISFDPTQLRENIEFFIGHIRKAKPATAKGQFLKRVCVSGTMTPSVTLEVD